MSAAAVLGALACTFFLAELLPQPVRLWRHRQAAGTSALGSGMTLVAELGWLGYGLTTGFTAVAVLAAVASIPKAAQLVLTWPHRQARDATAIAVWAAAVGVGLATSTVGAFLAVGLLLGLGPQALAVVRSADISGVSAWRWVLTAVSATAWLAYGAVLGAPALMAVGGLALVCAAGPLWRLGGRNPVRQARPGILVPAGGAPTTPGVAP
jgi:uncharacterized protein with PQ loop repeat